jgi:hypothetical protein
VVSFIFLFGTTYAGKRLKNGMAGNPKGEFDWNGEILAGSADKRDTGT